MQSFISNQRGRVRYTRVNIVSGNKTPTYYLTINYSHVRPQTFTAVVVVVMTTTLSPEQVRPGRARVTPPPIHYYFIILYSRRRRWLVSRDLIARLLTCRGALGPNTVIGNRARRSHTNEVKYNITYIIYKNFQVVLRV